MQSNEKPISKKSLSKKPIKTVRISEAEPISEANISEAEPISEAEISQANISEAEPIRTQEQMKANTNTMPKINETINHEELAWKIIDKFFAQDPNILVKHHLESYNDFFNNKIHNIFREKNPILIMKEQDEETKEYNYKAELYIGGSTGKLIYFGKPIIYDDSREHYMFPNEARLRNMTYALTLHVDVEVVYYIMNEDGAYVETRSLLEKIYLGKFPIMLNSDLCILNSLDKITRFNMGECRNDRGGYFIIDGKEKVLISQEKFADNMLYFKADFIKTSFLPFFFYCFQ